jgi:hypothetical protein
LTRLYSISHGLGFIPWVQFSGLTHGPENGVLRYLKFIKKKTFKISPINANLIEIFLLKRSIINQPESN